MYFNDIVKGIDASIEETQIEPISFTMPSKTSIEGLAVDNSLMRSLAVTSLEENNIFAMQEYLDMESKDNIESPKLNTRESTIVALMSFEEPLSTLKSEAVEEGAKPLIDFAKDYLAKMAALEERGELNDKLDTTIALSQQERTVFDTGALMGIAAALKVCGDIVTSYVSALKYKDKGLHSTLSLGAINAEVMPTLDFVANLVPTQISEGVNVGRSIYMPGYFLSYGKASEDTTDAAIASASQIEFSSEVEQMTLRDFNQHLQELISGIYSLDREFTMLKSQVDETIENYKGDANEPLLLPPSAKSAFAVYNNSLDAVAESLAFVYSHMLGGMKKAIALF